MRRQIRPAEPEVLRSHAAAWNQAWESKVTDAPGATFYWHVVDRIPVRAHLLPSLQIMTQEHCSFCDCHPLADRSLEPIEHFKPKKQFPAEAFSWANLYYACEYCQSAKREQWNDRLLRPDADDYEFGNYFVFDFTTGALQPNPQAGEAEQERATVTIALYGLDEQPRRRYRRLELRRWSRSAGRLIDEWSYRDYLEQGGMGRP